MAQPLSETDIIFPHLSNTPNIASTLSSLKRSTLSTHNRLSSIILDSQFVASVASTYSLPLVANERCGSWYIPSNLKSESVYFKSTDGHMGEWSFSLRRLNLQVLDVVRKSGGCVIVDSTRRGKSMPDALSKSVPIWCCVVNRVVFGDEMGLYVPPLAVSESEKAQIEARIGGFVRQFLDVCKPNVADLRAKLQKPLRPIWVTQGSTLPEFPPTFPDFHPVILCTASRRVRGAEVSEGGYIQGAADDHEAWSYGLTPQLFWANKDKLMSMNEGEAPSVIADLVKEERRADAKPTLIKPTIGLFISSSQNVDMSAFDVVISCTPDRLSHPSLVDTKSKHYLHLPCQAGKLGSRDLRTQLPKLGSFFASVSNAGKILICCPTGKDLSVGATLAVLCLYADEDGAVNVVNQRQQRDIGKSFIKQRLSWITTSNPALNPSRATLQSVNAVLLSSQDPKADSSPRSAIPIHMKPEDVSIPTKISDAPCPAQPKTNMAEERIFRTLSNHTWKFTRTLSSTLPTHPSGTVTGSATFTPWTSETSTSTLESKTKPTTLLYAEQGKFTTSTGLQFTTRKKYVYILNSVQTDPLLEDANVKDEGDDVKDEEDKVKDERDKMKDEKDEMKEGESKAGDFIAIHFVDDNLSASSSSTLSSSLSSSSKANVSVGSSISSNKKHEVIGGLFVEMDMLTHAAVMVKGEEGILESKNRDQHLCVEDLYTASWRFGSGMARGNRDEGTDKDKWWEVRYDVVGPRKEYVSWTRYVVI